MCPSKLIAGVVKLVDTLDLGSSASRRGGSSPFTRTYKTSALAEVFLFLNMRFSKRQIIRFFILVLTVIGVISRFWKSIQFYFE